MASSRNRLKVSGTFLMTLFSGILALILSVTIYKSQYAASIMTLDNTEINLRHVFPSLEDSADPIDFTDTTLCDRYTINLYGYCCHAITNGVPHCVTSELEQRTSLKWLYSQESPKLKDGTLVSNDANDVAFEFDNMKGFRFAHGDPKASESLVLLAIWCDLFFLASVSLIWMLKPGKRGVLGLLFTLLTGLALLAGIVASVCPLIPMFYAEDYCQQMIKNGLSKQFRYFGIKTKASRILRVLCLLDTIISVATLANALKLLAGPRINLFDMDLDPRNSLRSFRLGDEESLDPTFEAFPERKFI